VVAICGEVCGVSIIWIIRKNVVENECTALIGRFAPGDVTGIYCNTTKAGNRFIV